MTFQAEKIGKFYQEGKHKIKTMLPDNYLALCVEQIDVEGPEVGWTS